MPVMDGYEATRILRTDKDYAISIDVSSGSRHDSGKDLSRPLSPRSSKDVSVDESESQQKNMLRDIPVIAMTASAIQGDREKCHDAGMDDYLAKPVERVSLEEMLVKWAGRRREG